MNVTVFSVIMSSLIGSVFILAVHMLRNNTLFLNGFGVPAILLLHGMCIGRMVLPVEFFFTTPLRLSREYNGLFHKVTTYVVHIGGIEVGLFEALGFVWLLGAGIMLAVFLIRYGVSQFRLQRFVNYRCPGADEVFQKVQERFGCRHKVHIFMYPGLDTPMATGICRKCILLPPHNYTEEELYSVLAHEVTHFNNHDQLISWLSRLFQCIFWWNPLVYLLWADLEPMLETKCDMVVLQTLSESGIALDVYTDLLADITRKSLQGGGSRKSRKRKLFSFFKPLTAMRMFNRKKESLVMTKRIEAMLGLPVKKAVTTVQVVFFVLCFVLVAFSYKFVLQPYYEPPVDDIYTDSSAFIYESNIFEGYIFKDKDGNYFFIEEGGKKFYIKEESVELFQAAGCIIKEESTENEWNNAFS